MSEQKYKIYINGKPVFLSTAQGIGEMGLKASKNAYVAPYSGKKKMLLQYLDLLDKNKSVESVAIFFPDLDQLWRDFQGCFEIIEAAGGFVLNSEGQLLVFYRRGSWDLPKGKIDPGETPDEAAVREVKEETGLQSIELGEFITHTYHTYEQKGKRILKRTWWFAMTTPDSRVAPQTEEDIELIEWVEPENWLATDPFVYPNIREIIEFVTRLK
jgi:8-oxo-dGTP pyrophosphatase MutT (NUDIX family)